MVSRGRIAKLGTFSRDPGWGRASGVWSLWARGIARRPHAPDVYRMALSHRTTGTGISLPAAINAVNNKSLPITPLHWNGRIAVTSVNEWENAFEHFRTRGDSKWTGVKTAGDGQIPVAAEVHFDYVGDNHTMTLKTSKIWTPDSTIVFQGTLAKKNSRLQTEVSAITSWNGMTSLIR